jgi:site-specific DNA-cytosine methylase
MIGKTMTNDEVNIKLEQFKKEIKKVIDEFVDNSDDNFGVFINILDFRDNGIDTYRARACMVCVAERLMEQVIIEGIEHTQPYSEKQKAN